MTRSVAYNHSHPQDTYDGFLHGAESMPRPLCGLEQDTLLKTSQDHKLWRENSTCVFYLFVCLFVFEKTFGIYSWGMELDLIKRENPQLHLVPPSLGRGLERARVCLLVYKNFSFKNQI